MRFLKSKNLTVIVAIPWLFYGKQPPEMPIKI